MKVPLLDLKPQLESLHGEILEAVTRVVKSTQYIMGPEIEGLEKEIAEYCGTADAVGVSSGTDALLLSLMALDIGPGDIVLTSDFSFFATAGVISRLNATPVFLDIDPDTWNLDPRQVEQKLESMSAKERKRVKAIIVVHLYGQSAEMKPLLDCAESYGIPVIEDAAQAIGAEYELNSTACKVGSMGTFGCFSFFPSKNLGGIGDGGIITVQDPELASVLRLKRVHGGKKKYYHRVIGGNFRLDPIQAAVIRVKLPHLSSWHRKRRENAHYYNQLFEKAGLAPRILTPPELHNSNLNFPHIYNQYVIRAEKRDELQQYLRESDCASEVYYPIPFHLQECFSNLECDTSALKNSEEAAKTVLALPIYPELPREMQEYMVERIASFFLTH